MCEPDVVRAVEMSVETTPVLLAVPLSMPPFDFAVGWLEMGDETDHIDDKGED